MPIVPPPPDRPRPVYHEGPPPDLGRFALLGLLPALVVLGLCYYWFVQRVEVPAGKVLVLMHKTGRPLPPEAEDQVVLYPALLEKLGETSDSTRFRGIMYSVKGEGRYFYDPFFWERRLFSAVVTDADEIGVLIRKYGRPLPEGKVVATEPYERGPLERFIDPGVRENINPFAYTVKLVPRVNVPAGSVGVQTQYAGAAPQHPNRYVVAAGERGVQPDVLPPGLYNVNPYVKRVDIIDVRSHAIDFRADQAIHFPSKDSFDILIEGTVEYAIRQDKAPYVMAAVGDHEDIRTKLILPFMRSFARIEGSKLEAREFISGDTRKAFQDRVFEGLRKQCFEQGIEVRATLIRRIEPPAAIAEPISDRQLAEQRIQQYDNEIRLAHSQAQLVEQEEMQKQNQEIGKANREVVTLTKEAAQREAVALTEAQQRLEVARLELEAATETAAALMSHGQADAEVIRLQFEAQAKPLADAVAAFGGGDSYAQYFFYQKLGPAVKSVLASTEGPFAEIFRTLSTAKSGAYQPPPSEGPASAAGQVRRDGEVEP